MENTIKSMNSNNVDTLSGLSTDVSNLPKTLGTGSVFYCIDTQEVYMYEATTQTWIKQ